MIQAKSEKLKAEKAINDYKQKVKELEIRVQEMGKKMEDEEALEGFFEAEKENCSRRMRS